MFFHVSGRIKVNWCPFAIDSLSVRADFAWNVIEKVILILVRKICVESF